MNINSFGNSLSNINSIYGRMNKSINRMSSGLRINSGADDAAGLSIATRLSAQFRSLGKASNNIQDGVSLLRTAEGGLSSQSDGLQRLRELTIQAGNGAYTDSEIGALEDEANQIVAGMNDTAKRTEFNTKSLLDGSQGGKVSSASSNVQGYVKGSIQRSGSYNGQISSSLGEDGKRVFSVSISGTDGFNRTTTLDSRNRASGAINNVDLQLGDVDTAKVTGSGLLLEGTTAVTGAASTTITDSNGDAVTLNLAAGTATNSDIVDQLNIDLAGASVDVRAAIDDDGNLNFAGQNSTEDFTISGTNSEFSDTFGQYDGTVNAGAGKAQSDGNTLASLQSEGVDFSSQVSFDVRTSSGSTANIQLGGVDVAMSRDEIESQINDQLSSLGVTAKFDDSDQLTFESNDVGQQSRITITDRSAGTESLSSSLGVSDQTASGTGDADFNLNVFGRALNFQTGANQKQSSDFSFGDFSSGGLNIDDVDFSSEESRNEFLGRVDEAIDDVSSARSSIGSQENRFQSEFRNLESYSTNIAASESRIRDMNVALEAVQKSQDEALLQASLYAHSQGMGLKGMLVNALL
jgi:flagellin